MNGGWFLFPYSALHILGVAFDVPSSTLRPGFFLAHLFTISLLILEIRSLAQKEKWQGLLFWSGIWVLCIWAGAYLEFPSDAWEHVKRVASFDKPPFPAAGSFPLKSYYWILGSVVGAVDPIHKRQALDGLSALMILGIAYQTYLLGLALDLGKTWSRVLVVAFLCLFGSNVFGVRYYALASTGLAYFCYLWSLRILLTAQKDGDVRKLLGLPILVWVAAINHAEEVLLLGISVGAWAVYSLWKKYGHSHRRLFRGVTATLLLLGLAYGIYARYFGPSWVYGRVPVHEISKWGSFRIWNIHHAFFHTWGIPGTIGLFLSLFFVGTEPLAVAWILAPAFVLVYPPTSVPIAWIFPDGYIVYRVLFASFWFLPWILLARRWKSPLAPWIAGLCFIAVGASAKYPWRGRLRHLVYRPPVERTLENADPMAQWLFQNRSPYCWYVTDRATGMFLEGFIRHPNHLGRLTSGWKEDYTAARIRALMVGPASPCGILVSLGEKPWPRSFPPRYSGHWVEDSEKLLGGAPFYLRKSAADLVESGWVKTNLPGNYILVEPPGIPRTASSE